MFDRIAPIALALLVAPSLFAQPPAPAEGDRPAIEGRGLAAEQRAPQLATTAEARRRAAPIVGARHAALAGRVEQSERTLRAAEARQRGAETARAAAADRLAAQRAPLARLVAALVRDARRPAALALIAPDDVTASERRRIALAAFRPAIEARSAAVSVVLARSDAAAAQAEAALRAVELARDDLARERHALADAETGLPDGRDMILADAATAHDQAQELDAQIASRRRDARLGARLATLEDPHPRPERPARSPPRDPAYRLPVSGRVLVGEGELSRAGARARGLTLATAPGGEVVAPAAGRVAYAGPFRAWRAIVILDHGHGWITLVTGLDRAAAHVGAFVAQGEPIGRTDGRVTIELRHRGRPVDVTGMIEAS